MATILKFPKQPHAAKQETEISENKPAGRRTGIEEGADFETLTHSEIAKACVIRERVRDAISSLKPDQQAIITSAMYELGGDGASLSDYVPERSKSETAQYLHRIINEHDTPLSRLAADPDSKEFASALRALRYPK